MPNSVLENELERKLKVLDAKTNSFFELLEERDRENTKKEVKISELLHDLAELIRKNEENNQIIQTNREFISELYFIIKIGGKQEEEEGGWREGGGREKEGRREGRGWEEEGRRIGGVRDEEGKRAGGGRVEKGRGSSLVGGMEEEGRKVLGVIGFEGERGDKGGGYWEGMEGEIMREVNKKRAMVERIYQKNEQLSLNEGECRVCLIF